MAAEEGEVAEEAVEMESMLADVAGGLGLGEEEVTETVEVAKEPTGEVKEEVKVETKAVPEVKATPETKTSSKAVESTDDPVPKTWRKEAHACWKGLPPEAKAEIRKREEDVMSGISQYKAYADHGSRFLEAAKPYLAILQQHKIDPSTHAANLFATHHALVTGTIEQKTAIINRLVNEFHIPLDKLTSSSSAAADPAVSALQAQLQSVQSILAGNQTREEEATKAKLLSEVESFAKDPTHEFWDQVSEDIAVLLQSGACKTLQDAYDTAVARNPVTRQAHLEKFAQQREETRRRERATEAQRARRSTAANVRSTSKPKGPTAPKGSIDDTLSEAYDRLAAE